MHIELIDLLRCPEAHEETWLVAAFNSVEGREIVDAKLGCPVCRREFLVVDGIADFGAPIAADSIQTDPMNTAAFLDLTSPGKTILLAGAFAVHSSEIAEATEARVIALNSASRAPHDHVLEIRASSRMPLGSNSLDGVALDRAHSTDFLISEAARLVRPGGRIVTSSNATLAEDFRELARD